MIRAPKTAKDVLTIINDFFILTEPTYSGKSEDFANRTDEASKLWDILTALRGPDDTNLSLKEATTAVIRYHALPVCDKNGATVYKDCIGNEIARHKYESTASRHFISHAKNAFKALGLDWIKTNSPFLKS